MIASCAPRSFRVYCHGCAGGRMVLDSVCPSCGGPGVVAFDGTQLAAWKPCDAAPARGAPQPGDRDYPFIDPYDH